MPPEHRPVVHSVFKELRDSAVQKLEDWGSERETGHSVSGLRRVLFELGLGKFELSPFPTSLVE